MMATTLSLFSVTATAGEVESSIARGGELYDKWFKVVNADTPKSPNPAYPSDKKYYGKKRGRLALQGVPRMGLYGCQWCL